MAHSINIQPNPHELPSEEEESYVDYYYDDPEDLPGTLDLEPDAPPPEIALIDYTENIATRIKIVNPEVCISYLKSESVSWINVLGLGNQTSWQQMAKVFQIHPLSVGDIVNVPQRPKVINDKNLNLNLTQKSVRGLNIINFENKEHLLITINDEKVEVHEIVE